MKCPACQEVLIVLEFNEVEIDYCVACHGIWLDTGELALLFGDRPMASGFMTDGDIKAAAGMAKRRCPECDAVMEHRVTRSAHPVVYDRCPHGDGLWFDAGELGIVLTYGSEIEGGAEVSAWLHDMLGTGNGENVSARGAT